MNNTERIGEQKIMKLLLEFSVPAIIGMLVAACYNIIDRVFIGHSVGDLGIAAVTVAFPMMTIQMAFAGLVGMGATANISIKLGQNDKKGAQLISGNTVTLLAVVTVLLTTFGLLFIDPSLRLFGASDEVLPLAREYMQIILIGTVFQSFSFGMNNMIRAEGKPMIAMATMLIGTALNVILAPLFIFVFHWGIRGAALATILSQMVSATWIFIHFLTGNGLLRLRLSNLRPRLDISKQIMTLGLPSFAMQLAQCVLTAIMNTSLLKYGGDVAISGMGIVNSLSTLIVLPIIGVNQGAQPIIGYNYGANKFNRVTRTLAYAIIAETVISTFGFIVTRLFPRELIAVFDSSDKALIDFGSYAVTVFMMMLPIVGFQIAGSGYFQAVGKPRQAMILSLSRQVIVLIPALLILPHFFQMQGVLASGPISDFISALVTGVWLTIELRSLKQKHMDSSLALKNEPAMPAQRDIDAIAVPNPQCPNMEETT